MKLTFSAILMLFILTAHGQNRTLYGRVIDENDYLPIPGIFIENTDRSLIGKTEQDGRFKIVIPQNTQTLIFGFPGFENEKIKLSNDCDTVEVVMLGASTYDFISSRKVDEQRLKQFNTLPDLHLRAYKKGLFVNESVCYTAVFVPEKRQLDSIAREDVETRKKIRQTFRRLNVGDTVRIPFSDAGSYRADGTDRTTLTAYSSYTGGHGHHSGCIISCVILSKNRHTRLRRFRYRNYNIVCQVIDCSGCKDRSVYEDKVMKPEVIFTYNMRYGEILGTQNFK